MQAYTLLDRSLPFLSSREFIFVTERLTKNGIRGPGFRKVAELYLQRLRTPQSPGIDNRTTMQRLKAAFRYYQCALPEWQRAICPHLSEGDQGQFDIIRGQSGDFLVKYASLLDFLVQRTDDLEFTHKIFKALAPLGFLGYLAACPKLNDVRHRGFFLKVAVSLIQSGDRRIETLMTTEAALWEDHHLQLAYGRLTDELEVELTDAAIANDKTALEHIMRYGVRFPAARHALEQAFLEDQFGAVEILLTNLSQNAKELDLFFCWLVPELPDLSKQTQKDMTKRARQLITVFQEVAPGPFWRLLSMYVAAGDFESVRLFLSGLKSLTPEKYCELFLLAIESRHAEVTEYLANYFPSLLQNSPEILIPILNQSRFCRVLIRTSRTSTPAIRAILNELPIRELPGYAAAEAFENRKQQDALLVSQMQHAPRAASSSAPPAGAAPAVLFNVQDIPWSQNPGWNFREMPERSRPAGSHFSGLPSRPRGSRNPRGRPMQFLPLLGETPENERSHNAGWDAGSTLPGAVNAQSSTYASSAPAPAQVYSAYPAGSNALQGSVNPQGPIYANAAPPSSAQNRSAYPPGIAALPVAVSSQAPIYASSARGYAQVYSAYPAGSTALPGSVNPQGPIYASAAPPASAQVYSAYPAGSSALQGTVNSQAPIYASSAPPSSAQNRSAYPAGSTALPGSVNPQGPIYASSAPPTSAQVSSAYPAGSSALPGAVSSQAPIYASAAPGSAQVYSAYPAGSTALPGAVSSQAPIYASSAPASSAQNRSAYPPGSASRPGVVNVQASASVSSSSAAPARDPRSAGKDASLSFSSPMPADNSQNRAAAPSQAPAGPRPAMRSSEGKRAGVGAHATKSGKRHVAFSEDGKKDSGCVVS